MEFLRSFQARLEPYFINNQIYFLSGFGYLKSPDRWKNVLYGIYSAFCFFSMTIVFTIQILDVYLLLDDFEQLMQDMCAILVTFVMVIKMYVISFRAHMVEDLQRDFIRFRMSRRHPEEEEIWEKASKMIYTMTKTFYYIGLPCVIFWMIFPALDKTSERSLPYPWVFPVDYHLSPYYEIVYVFQSLNLFSFLINIVSADVAYCSYVVLIIAQYDALARDIKIISSAYDDERSDTRAKDFSRTRRAPLEKTEASMKALGNSIEDHNYILRQVDKLHAIHSDFLFLQMSLTALLIAVLLLDIVVNSRELSLKLFQRLLYTISAGFDAWLMCYWGTQLQEKSYSFAQELYNSPWIEMDVPVRKTFMMMMMRAQKAPKLKNGMIAFELPLFLEIMKYSYNVTALFKTG